MNAMLKAQMLGTALDVYFSSSALGGNRLGSPVPIGSLNVDLSGVCAAATVTCTGGFDSLAGEQGTFGLTAPAHCMTVTQMLAHENAVSNAGGTVWYGNVKSTQQFAKDAFDSIDNQVAYTC